MDDGFQHLALRRDIDILVMDAASPFGNGMVLPAGPLREPPSAIRRADVIWLVGEGEIPPAVHTYAPDAPVVRAVATPCGLKTGSGKELPLETLMKKRVVAFAGIGRPGRFFESLDRLGAIVAEHTTFPDHHRYNGADLARLEGRATAARAHLVVTTEKDLARLPAGASFTRNVAALVMGLTVRGDDILVKSICAKLHKEST
jgi:tetraacyldisaccharide 4'-kinase